MKIKNIGPIEQTPRNLAKTSPSSTERVADRINLEASAEMVAAVRAAQQAAAASHTSSASMKRCFWYRPITSRVTSAGYVTSRSSHHSAK
jgi:hypothetical protein